MTANETFPIKPPVGVNCRPFRAALRLANVPCTVIDDELLAPDVMESPFVVTNVSVPLVTVSVSCSILLPALASVIEIALPLPLENTSAVFSTTDAIAGAVIDGGALS